MNLIFMPMFAIGLMGVNRRLWDAGASYAHAQPTLQWQTHMTYAALLLGLFQMPFLWNIVSNWSRDQGSGIGDQGGGIGDQGRRIGEQDTGAGERKDTGTTSARLGMWLFIASEVMLFASLLSGYVMLRAGATEWPRLPGGIPWVETLLLVGASAVFSHERIRLIISNALGLTFVAIKVMNDLMLIEKGITPATNLMCACWFTLTAVHSVHVLCGALFTGWLAGPSYRMSVEDKERFRARIESTRRYWLFVDAVWLILIIGFYVV